MTTSRIVWFGSLAVASLLIGGAVFWWLPGLRLLAWGLIAVGAVLALAAGVVPDPHAKPEPLMTGHAPDLSETLLRVRCGMCGSEFEIVDPGVRPADRECPACGAATMLPEPRSFDQVRR